MKSAFRFAAGLNLILAYFEVPTGLLIAGIALIAAELLGVLEELV